MTELGRRTLLLLWLLQSAPGRPHLAPPQNVTLFSWNFSVYLTWQPGPGHPQNVTYSVAYQSSATPRRWRKVKKCSRTKELACSLMCLEKQDLYNKFKGRVRAVSPSARSPWVESKYLEYLFEVEPAPPVLKVTRTKEVLSINATYQLPPCMPPPDLKYEVDFWKEGAGNKTRFPVTPHGQPVQISLQPAARGQHCLSARTIYTFSDTKYSEFSTPTCFSLKAPGINWAFLALLPLLLPPLLVIAMGCVIWRSCTGNPWFQQAKMPQVLDCSGHRHPAATFQPSGPELLDDLTLYPQKEVTRRVRLTPRVRAPASTQAESEDSAEEDTDDSVSFQPYIEPTCFLEHGRQTLGHAGAGTQAQGAPAWDASDRSWPSTADSSPGGEAGSSPGGVSGSSPGGVAGSSPGGVSGSSPGDEAGSSPRDEAGSSPWGVAGSSPWDEAGSSPWDEAGSSPGGVAGSSPGGEAGSSGYLAIKGLSRDRCEEPPPLPEFSQDSGSLEEPSKDDLPSWASWGPSSPRRNLVPGEPLVSLQTLTFGWDSGPEQEEEEEEEEEGGRESEAEDSGAGGWGADSLQRTKAGGRTLGCYMARGAVQLPAESGATELLQDPKRH